MYQFDYLELAVLARFFNAGGLESVYVKTFEFGATSGEFTRAIRYLEKRGLIEIDRDDASCARSFGFFRCTRLTQCRGALSQRGLEIMGGARRAGQRSTGASTGAGRKKARALSRW